MSRRGGFCGVLRKHPSTPPRRSRHEPFRRLHLLVLVLGAAPVQAQNLFANGSFETPTVNYQLLGGGSTAITGWTTVLSGVEHFNVPASGTGAAADGVMAVDLANFTFLQGGGLEQAVATQAGQRYDVSFFAGNSRSSGRDGTGIVRVTIDGSTTLDFATAAAASATTVWAQRSFSFVAGGSSTMLRFWNDQNPNLHFALIDGLGAQLAPVPEPGSGVLLLSGLAAAGWLVRARQRAA